MNRHELLLTCLAEEASEVAQSASKMNRFGMHSVFAGKAYSNAKLSHLELDDLMAIVEILNEEFDFGYTPNRDNIEAKKIKVNHMNTLHGDYNE